MLALQSAKTRHSNVILALVCEITPARNAYQGASAAAEAAQPPHSPFPLYLSHTFAVLLQLLAALLPTLCCCHEGASASAAAEAAQPPHSPFPLYLSHTFAVLLQLLAALSTHDCNE